MECSKCNIDKGSSHFYKKQKTICKTCFLKGNRERERSKEGFIKRLYHNQISGCRRRNHNRPEYTVEELQDFMYSNGYIDLHTSWTDSGYDMDIAPSIDRIDNTKTYALDNITLMTWGENNAKGNLEHRQKIKVVYDNGHKIVFDSVMEAVKKIGITQTTMHKCINTNNGYVNKIKAVITKVT